jgi:hypothetical protein
VLLCHGAACIVREPIPEGKTATTRG